ncbi:MAG TPA: hypothetical protein VNT22_01585 [Baekduia sp.]|nr:hypothetical protein [Baekduia sp.]
MRLRAGEIVGVLATVGLFAALFMDWTEDPLGTSSGWASLWIGVQLIVDLALLFALIVPLVIATRQTVAAQMVATSIAAFVSFVAVIALTIDVVQIAGDESYGNVTLLWPAYAAIGLAVVLFLGMWRSLADERVTAPESAYSPPPARPVPPA